MLACMHIGLLAGGESHAPQAPPRAHHAPAAACRRTPQVAIGQALRLRGDWVEHKQYGLQLRATDMEPLSPGTDDEMVAYLGGGAIPGVGPHYAQVQQPAPRSRIVYGAQHCQLHRAGPADSWRRVEVVCGGGGGWSLAPAAPLPPPCFPACTAGGWTPPSPHRRVGSCFLSDAPLARP